MTQRPVLQDVLTTLFGTAAGLVAVALIVLLAMWTLAPFILYGIYVRAGQVRDLLEGMASSRSSGDDAGPRLALASSNESRGPMVIGFLLVASIVVVVMIVFSK
jgi:hypothetical protein